MDIRQFKYFLEVANHLSFSKAGRQLHVSQPTLSTVIKHLEEELGVTLLDRSTKRIHLTDAGETVKAYAENIMYTIEDLYIALRGVTEAKRGKIKLGLPPVAGVSFFPEIISEFYDAYPQITVELIEEGSKIIERLVWDGELDLGVVVLPVDEQHFSITPLVKSQLNLVVNSKHPLAKPNIKVNISDLRNERFILFQRGFASHDRIRDACIREGFAPNIVLESAAWDFMGEMVAENLGICFLPETVCHRLDLTRCTIIRNLTNPIPFQLALVWRKNNYLSYATRTFVEFVQSFFNSSANGRPR